MSIGIQIYALVFGYLGDVFAFISVPGHILDSQICKGYNVF